MRTKTEHEVLVIPESDLRSPQSCLVTQDIQIRGPSALKVV